MILLGPSFLVRSAAAFEIVASALRNSGARLRGIHSLGDPRLSGFLRALDQNLTSHWLAELNFLDVLSELS